MRIYNYESNFLYTRAEIYLYSVFYPAQVSYQGNKWNQKWKMLHLCISMYLARRSKKDKGFEK